MLMAHLDIKFYNQLTSLHGAINRDFMWVPVIHFTQELKIARFSENHHHMDFQGTMLNGSSISHIWEGYKHHLTITAG
jgi:hypothetical protein